MFCFDFSLSPNLTFVLDCLFEKLRRFATKANIEQEELGSILLLDFLL